MYALLYAKNEPNFTQATGGIISFKKFQNGLVPFSIKSGRSYEAVAIDSTILNAFEQELHTLIKELFNPDIPIVEKEV